MNCNICSSETKLLFATLVMNKHQVEYHKCTQCEFIQTEKPYWLNEAYSSAITSLDIGYVTRNISLSEVVSSIVQSSFNDKGDFIDYGGGYGLFVRIMRDKGFKFYLQDPYCQNIFANYFDTSSFDEKKQFELLTTFEVFEHLDNPLFEIDKMFKRSSSVLFTTELQPNNNITKISDWWYFAPETGQHISLYSLKSLQFLAKKYNCNLYSNNYNLHLLTPKKFTFNPVKIHSLIHHYKDRILGRNFKNKKSLLQKDFSYIQKEIEKK
jgi:hypothetical protein